MTRQIRYALNGIDTHLTCFCAAGPTSDRPMNAIKRDATRDASTNVSFDFKLRYPKSNLSRQRNDLAHPWTRFTALICLTYAISTLFPRVMRSEFQLTCDRTQCIFYHAIRFSGSLEPILSWVSWLGFSQSGYAIYIHDISSVCKPGVVWRNDTRWYDHYLFRITFVWLELMPTVRFLSQDSGRRKLSRGSVFNVALYPYFMCSHSALFIRNRK